MSDIPRSRRRVYLAVILGGGYGLYLLRTILRREGERTLLDHWPEARSTNDLDLFLRPELMCDSPRLATLKSALDELRYEPVKRSGTHKALRYRLKSSTEQATRDKLKTQP